MLHRNARSVGGFGPPASTVPANSYNWDATTQFPNFKAAKAAMLAGTGRVIIGMNGDSNTAGYNGDTSYRTESFSAVIASTLGSIGSFDSFVGQGNQLGTSDTRIAFVGSAAFSGDFFIFGGEQVKFTGNGDGVDFTCTHTFDRIRITQIQTGGGVIDVGSNGNALTGTPTVNSGNNNIVATTFTVPRGTVANIRQVGSGTSYLQMVECYDSTTPRISVIDGGMGGQTSGGLGAATTGATYLAGSLAITPHLSLFMFGFNDANANPALTKAQFKANIQNGVSALQAINSDIIGLIYVPTDPSGVMETTYWTQYRDAINELAVAMNFPTINLHDHYPSWTVLCARTPSWYFDNPHMAAPMHADLGAFLGGVIQGIS